MFNLFFHPFFLPMLLIVVFVYKTFVSKSGNSTSNTKIRPPSPRKLPIIGNLHQLSPPIHRSLLSLSQQYGKLMLLHLGHKPTLVVSSVDAVREILKTNDIIFASRPDLRIPRTIFYDGKDVVFSPYGEHWRQMRSISVLHMLSTQKVQSFGGIREEETALVIEKINRLSSKVQVVNLSEIIISFTNDVICRAAFGKKYNNSESDNGDEGSIIFKELLHEIMELLIVICWGEYISCLSWVDWLKGLNGRVEKVIKEVDVFLDRVIQEHQNCASMNTNDDVDDDDDDAKCEKGKKGNTFVDTLLEYQRENRDVLPTKNIKAVILDMFVGGTETIYTLVEWMMSELIRHPKIMKELQDEVRKIGRGGRGQRISEDDLSKLTYLKAVIKETLRLHPPAPLLAFREAVQDVKLNGFDIDAGTQVVINAWAIQRDPAYWEQPEEFQPARFLTDNSTANVNFKGQDFQFIPFGGGRRICPGISFAMVSAELLVANLINEFDWDLPGGVDGEKLDMGETVGITVHKREPLMLIATPSNSTI